MDKSSNYLRVADLIVKFHTGTLTREESEELLCWRQESESNERLFSEMSSQYDLEEFSLESHRFLPEESWENLRQRIFPGRKRKKLWSGILKYTAILVPIGLFAFSGYLYFDASKAKELPLAQVDERLISHGTSRALLILDDGARVELNDTSCFAVKDAVVNNQNGVGLISYRGDSLESKGKSGVNRLIVPKKGEYKVELSDGTMVFLNADTEFAYPVNFTGNERRVELKGEAYFIVARDEKMPFVVETAGMDVRVLGTEFNVNAYDRQKYTSTTLVSGSVEVDIAGKESMVLKPSYQVRLDRETNEADCVKVNTLPYTAWKDGKFVFNHENLETITDRLEKWYGVRFCYRDEKLKQVKVFGIISRYENIGQVLDLIRATEVLDFESTGENIVVKSHK